jgi:hypothetical protein
MHDRVPVPGYIYVILRNNSRPKPYVKMQTVFVFLRASIRSAFCLVNSITGSWTTLWIVLILYCKFMFSVSRLFQFSRGRI